MCTLIVICVLLLYYVYSYCTMCTLIVLCVLLLNYICTLIVLQPVSYKRYFRCKNCVLLLVYAINLSLSTDLVDPYGENTFSVKPPVCVLLLNYMCTLIVLCVRLQYYVYSDCTMCTLIVCNNVYSYCTMCTLITCNSVYSYLTISETKFVENDNPYICTLSTLVCFEV